MDKAFFQKKIVKLSNEALIALLEKTGNNRSPEIFSLAQEEAELRNLKFVLASTPFRVARIPQPSDLEKLKKWNWGAFLIPQYWTLTHNLTLWSYLSLIPGPNLVAMFYLGFKGNRLAFRKSNLDTVEDFMTIQRIWRFWGIILASIWIIGRLASGEWAWFW